MKGNYDHCFACGKANPRGLHLDFEYDTEGRAFAKVKLSADFAGYPGVIHGGIISTILDEVMANVVMHSGKMAFTAKLQVRYRMSLPVDTEVQAEGWIEMAKSRTISTKARLFGKEGIYAEAEAIFMLPPDEKPHS